MEFTMNAMCQALYSEGFTKREEDPIERYLVQLAKSSGPEFVISRLKALKEFEVEKLVNPGASFSSDPWIAFSHTKGRPKGPLGMIWKRKTERVDRIKTLGALTNAIILDTLTPKQLEKFESGVRTPRDDERAKKMATPSPQLYLTCAREHARSVLESSSYSPLDITAKRIPIGKDGMTINRTNSKSHNKHQLIKKLSVAYVASYVTASADAHLLSGKFEEYFESKDCKQKRGLPINPWAIRKGAHDDLVPQWYTTTISDLTDEPDDLYGSVSGHIGFIQNPGGKLRTVANPNRFTQHVLQPFHNALERGCYSRNSVHVKSQKQGVYWAQQQIAEGHHLVSADLSSATDTLDAHSFMDKWQGSFYKWVEDHKIGLTREDEEALELFESAQDLFFHEAEGLWYDPTHDRMVQWASGQPLGLKGSFPMLTLMNATAAEAAIHNVEPSLSLEEVRERYACVGDDLIIQHQYAAEYAHQISLMGGISNAEKALSSPVYAEFLSQLISADRVIPLKPKYSADFGKVFNNFEKSGYSEKKAHLMRLGKGTKQALETLSQWSYAGSDIMPKVKGPKTLPQKQRQLASVLLKHVAISPSAEPENLEFSGEAMRWFIQESLEDEELEDIVQYFSDCTQDGVLEAVSTGALVQPVKVGYAVDDIQYDHHTHEYKVNLDPRKSFRALSRKLYRLEGDMESLETTVTFEGHDLRLTATWLTDNLVGVSANIENVNRPLIEDDIFHDVSLDNTMVIGGQVL